MSQDGDRVATSSPEEHTAQCIKAIEDYRGRNITKWKAIAQILSALESATASTNSEQRSTAGETYLAMLDNMTEGSPESAPMDFRNQDGFETTTTIRTGKRSLMERLGLNDPDLEVLRPQLNDTKLTSRYTPGK